MRLSIDKTLWPALLLLTATFAVFEFTSLDLWIQDFFYNFNTKSWLIDEKSPIPKFFFYNGPKYLLILFAVTSITLCCLPVKLYNQFAPKNLKRINLLIAILTLTIAPSLVAWSKATTNIFCPYEITRYDGFAPYVRVLDSYPENDKPKKRGRGFPAGHASGGFALVSLAGLSATGFGRRLGIFIGLSFGSAMGIYQMLKGAHYLSHTLVTAIFCWIVFLIWRKIFKVID
jgi:membrane-associated PAP2 superfamily phosphatase